MAKKYSRDRGSSGSKRVLNKDKSIWVGYKPKEVEMLIVKLAKEGKSSSEIGITLRDSYGIPSVKNLTGKSITKIMQEKKLLPQLPEDLTNLMKKALDIRDHLKNNHKDTTAKRGLELTESKIRKMVTYYKKKGALEETWKYNPKNAKLYVD